MADSGKRDKKKERKVKENRHKIPIRKRDLGYAPSARKHDKEKGRDTDVE